MMNLKVENSLAYKSVIDDMQLNFAFGSNKLTNYSEYCKKKKIGHLQLWQSALLCVIKLSSVRQQKGNFFF